MRPPLDRTVAPIENKRSVSSDNVNVRRGSQAMSGILGFVSCQRWMVDVDRLRRGLRLLRHRGPDEAGIVLCDASGHSLLRGETAENPEVMSTLGLPENYGSVALACCRLRTEDPCDPGTQAVFSDQAQSFLACDGVIDNGPELRRKLERLHNWSFWFDLRIILLTAWSGIFGKNAY